MLIVMLLVLCTVLFVSTSEADEVPSSLQGVKVFHDLEYSKVGNTSLLLDLYVPENPKGRLPVIVYFHGGGWAMGDKTDDALPAHMGFVQQGYAVASVNYRLSEEAIFPAQIIDCKSAIRWLRANSDKYHLDSDHFAAWGYSAGAHLAALVGVTDGVKEFEAGDNLSMSDRVQAVCWYAGVADITTWVLTPGYELYGSPEGYASLFLGSPVLQSKDKAAKASPITYVNKHSSPFLVVHGDIDGSCPLGQAQMMHEALVKSGVDSQLLVVTGRDHCGLYEATSEMMEQITALFNKYMKSQSL